MVETWISLKYLSSLCTHHARYLNIFKTWFYIHFHLFLLIKTYFIVLTAYSHLFEIVQYIVTHGKLMSCDIIDYSSLFIFNSAMHSHVWLINAINIWSYIHMAGWCCITLTVFCFIYIYLKKCNIYTDWCLITVVMSCHVFYLFLICYGK